MASEWTEYGAISDRFESAQLADLCLPKIGIQTGPFGSQLHKRDYVEQGTPILTVEHLGENRIARQNLPCVSEDDRKRLKKYTLKAGDIVFSRVGSVDRRSLVRQEEDGWLFSGRCLRVRTDHHKIDPEYLSWFFGLHGFQEYIRKVAVGATMPSINTQILADILIYYPSMSEQQAIAHILGRLDDRIELNRKMNETLETMAQALFKSWFVEPALSTLPNGWSESTLGEVAENLRSGIQPDQIALNTPYIGLEHMPRRCVALSDWGSADGLGSNKFEFKCGQILFGKLRPYFHKVGVAPVNGVCSTDILVIEPKTPSWFGFVLGHVSSVELVNYTDAASTGTKMPRTNWKDISKFKVALPPESLAEKFTEQITPLIDRIIANIHESRTLSSLRNTLLPKLLSGELDVSARSEPAEINYDRRTVRRP